MRFESFSKVFVIVISSVLITGRCDRSDVHVDKQDTVEGMVKSNTSSSPSGEGVGLEENARYGFTPPQIPMDAFFPQLAGPDANGTLPNPFVGNPIATSLAVAKGGLLAALSLAKAALPHALLGGIILALLLVGLVFILGPLTEYGSSSVRGSHPYEPDYYNRNSYEYDLDKIRHVYQGVDEHKYKYNQVNHEKEYQSGI